uniref:N5-carboxyaminoimidazole ribonucleotide synthase n=1 Tax=Thermorudis peleae TaxID=1382356 RepID=A0A831TFZ4_9BACT
MRIGILGGGQLGRMLALAGYPLGLHFRFLDPAPDAPAGQVGELVVGAYDDPEALGSLVESVDLVTYEFENVPAGAVEWLTGRVPAYPPPRALETAQDRLSEKRLFEACGIPVPAYAPVSSEDELEHALASIGLPALLKTRRLGYDGKGQARIMDGSMASAAWRQLGGVPCLLERLVPFDREVSVLAARSRDGSTTVYPIVENEHREGILFCSRAPARNERRHLQEMAEAYARRVLDALDYVGMLAIEFFVVDDQLLANEMAPRVHNSGHWTIEGAETSQFEQHLRAILGLPLGEVNLRGYTGMVNLLGSLPPLEALLRVPGAHVHIYGKAPRPRRKLGHVTVLAASAEERERRLAQLFEVIERAGEPAPRA